MLTVEWVLKYSVVWVVRHSESTFNAEGRWAGWLDPPLTDRGVASAVAATPTWRDRGVTGVTSSTLRRAAQGANVLASGLVVDRVDSLPGLRERNAGAWQGQLVASLINDPLYRAWQADPRTCPPRGEAYADFLSRLDDSVRFLLAREQMLLAVTHDGVLTGLCDLFDLSRPARMLPLVDAVEVRVEVGVVSARVVLAADEAA